MFRNSRTSGSRSGPATRQEPAGGKANPGNGVDATAAYHSTSIQTQTPTAAFATDPTSAGPALPERSLPIGRLLIDAKRISTTDAQRVLRVAAKYNIPFGEAGMRMGLLKPSDVDYALSRQYSFPFLSSDDISLSNDLVAAYSPNDPTTEQMRALRTQILLRGANGSRAHPVVALVSPDRGDGRSFIAANLAVVFAQLGQRTLLIDADMRSPIQHHMFKLQNRMGLSTILAERCGIECVSRIASLQRLFVLPAGPMPPNPIELLEGPVFRRVLSSADANFDAIVIDTPAAEEGTDALIIGSRAGSAALVVRLNRTRANTGNAFAKALTAAKASLLGVVYNQA
jgi:protein-tyrosine kinase